MTDSLNKDIIISNLKNTPKIKIELFNEIDSTNIYLKQKAKEGEAENTLVIANRQINGHGRFDRKFHSPEGTGIYMSLLLRPATVVQNTVLITAAAAVAVAEAVKQVANADCKIKWVNDIYFENKKVCGILCEGAVSPENSQNNYIVVGIGLNVYPPENGFDKSIENIAGAVLRKPEKDLRNRLIAEIIRRFYLFYENLSAKEFLPQYKALSNVIGKEITVIKPDGAHRAVATGIDDDCRLAVKYPDGKEELLFSGEINSSIKI